MGRVCAGIILLWYLGIIVVDAITPSPTPENAVDSKYTIAIVTLSIISGFLLCLVVIMCIGYTTHVKLVEQGDVEITEKINTGASSSNAPPAYQEKKSSFMWLYM